ncbi:MAG TPA: EpsG family protein [Niabella sp.]|nr:EpsG family protein [Niabella sp.]HOZ97362.1 EpsG family protein [Niabella sp.]HQW15367.1 EpsG family protein [Niabella sp.]HQX20587.1 EpsG family protein [Niabella sp.]HQX40972.1 EpsG family protein [Niabella sp.]
MDSIQWANNWYYFVEAVVLIAIIRIWIFKPDEKGQLPAFSQILLLLSFILIPIYFSLEPIIENSDKWAYELGFRFVAQGIFDGIPFADSGYFYYVYLLTKVISNTTIFFWLTACIYLLGYVLFVWKKVNAGNRFVLLLAFIVALGFYNYGVNTIRAGVALSIFMIAISRKQFWKSTIPMLLLAVLVHKTALLPTACFLVSKIYKPKHHFLYIWIICLTISALAGSKISDLLGSFFDFADNRVNTYLGDNNFAYKTGFRVDFIIYSLAPILLAFYFKRKGFDDKFYNQLLSSYILCNAFWLLLIRIPFTDRLAALSWVLIPYLALYPLLSGKLFEKQNYWLAAVLLVLSGISFYLNILR